MKEVSSNHLATKYSVLIAVHGSDDPPLFKAALNSLALQTAKAEEVVLVKDGQIGPELTSLIDAFMSKLPMNVISLKECNGLGLALREGLSHCKHELVGRADSDDVNLAHRFEKQVAFLNDNADVAVVGSNLVEVDGTTTRLKRVPKLVQLGFRSFFRNPLNHQTVMFRKQAVLQVGGYEDCPSFEDYLLWCKLLKKNVRISNTSEPLVRANIENLTKKRHGHQYAIREKLFYARLAALLPQFKVTILLAASMRILVRYTPKFFVKIVYRLLRVSN